ncbi:GNAT family N-acetyltransferase [Chitinophaga sp. Cy-1792]|uniref:GNAT family N-acetyltransferase n=1 Tax=Chitinophaga sp. Cy-1792 TaxID=2608339 RepID=UPI0014244A30|nr:GNAT family N-acetyltransferase [Chitinophaga sp. Cy-1792]NIG54833.1 GNAT family N-acetyltransferase [Chitinophaga sp. Cy-1792]
MLHTDFYPFPLITTNRLVLRELKPSDDAAIYQLRSDPAVNMYLNRAPCTDRVAAQRFITAINNNIANATTLYWAITSPDGLIGTIGLWQYDTVENSVELGYELLPAHQGKGFIQEAMTAIIRFAFEKMHARKIAANVVPDNLKSIRALEKQGFQPQPHNGIAAEITYVLTATTA